MHFWGRIAFVAGIFTVSLSLIIVTNFLAIRLNNGNSDNAAVIESIITRLSENPNSLELVDEVLRINLRAQNAFFHSDWQALNGMGTLAFGLLVFAVSLAFYFSAVKNQTDGPRPNHWASRKTPRWLAYCVFGIISLAIVLSSLTHRELKASLKNPVAAYNLAEATRILTTASKTIDQPQKTLEEVVVEEIVSKDESYEVEEKDKLKDTLEIAPKVAETKPKAVSKKPAPYPTNDELIKNHSSFRGFGGNGITIHKNIPTSWDGPSGKNVLWKAKIPLHGYNSPVIWEDKVFVSGADATRREIYCFDRHNGQLIWTANAGNITGTPAKSPDVRGDTGHAAPTVATDGRYVFAMFSNGDIMAVDMNGKRVWAKNLGMPQNHYGHSSSLITYKDNVIVQYDDRNNPRVMALSSSTGDEVWSTPRNVRVSWASPILIDTGKRSELMLIADPTIVSYNPTTGAELWSIKGMSGEVGPSLAYADGVVYGVNQYASLMAVKIGNEPQLLWEDDDHLSDIPSPVVYNNLLFMATSYGAMVCYDAKDGTMYWEHDFYNGFFASPMVAEGRVYLLDRTGTMYIIKAEDEFSLISESKLGENISATPAFANGNIYIRGDEHLYCIGK